MNDAPAPRHTDPGLELEYDFMRDAAELRRRRDAGMLTGSGDSLFTRGERMLLAASLLSAVPPAVMLVLYFLR